MSLPLRTAVLVFLSFAFAYFPSALVRGVVATLAPNFSAELQLTAADLGLLGGAYFFGFAVVQLPLGSALDRFGPKRTLLAFLTLAVLGCMAFAAARGVVGLTLARMLIGIGVGACLMAPMTSFRRNFRPVAQMRATSWILMTGSLGMVASTLPVQWLLPLIGWRGLFWGLALLFAAAMVFIAWAVPADGEAAAELSARDSAPQASDTRSGYRQVFRHPTFIRYLPMAFFQYGALVALQSLWIGPWLSRVCGWSASATASGLFAINLAMLMSFMTWGAAMPRLFARGWTAHGLIARGMPVSLVALFAGVALGVDATAWVWALFCVSSTFVSLSQPAVAQAFASGLAGRALTAFNLVLFLGVFVLQWGVGAIVDAFVAAGWDVVSAFRASFALVGVGCVSSYVWFLWRDEENPHGSVAVEPR